MSKAYFIDDMTIEIEAPNGDVVDIKFGSKSNSFADKFFKQHNMKSVTDLIEAIFDKHYKGDPSIAFGEVTRAFALNHLEIPFSAGLNKNQERKRVGELIKSLRKKKNMDAKVLAARVGIDAANLCRIEQGRYSVGLDILCKIASALDARLGFIENSQND